MSTHYYCIFFYLSKCQYFWKCFSSPCYLRAWSPSIALNTAEVPRALTTSLVTFRANRAHQPWTDVILASSGHSIMRTVSSHQQTYLSAFSKVSQDTEKEVTYPELKTFQEIHEEFAWHTEGTCHRYKIRLTRSQTRNGSVTKVIFPLTLEELKNKPFFFPSFVISVCHHG